MGSQSAPIGTPRVERFREEYQCDRSVCLGSLFDADSHDAAYAPLFEPIIFALLDCGFTPRCALEVDDAGQVRFEKILALVKRCRFAIHDISRTELDRRNRLPRFNMPLELGLFLGAHRFGSGEQRRKACLVLDREPYRYQKFISDIAMPGE